MNELEQFAMAVRALFAAHAELVPPRAAHSTSWGTGPDDVSPLFADVSEEQIERQLVRARAWQAIKYDAGYAWLTGPVEFGGSGLGPEYAAVFAAIEAEHEVPDTSCFGVGQGMVVPALLAFAAPDLVQRFVPALRRGDQIACQLFSEPGAGSDLAAVRTTAEPDGESWLVSGQKVWTSWAQHSDLGLLLARTSPGGRRHDGLTMFLLDMTTPGVRVRPLRQMTGGAHFNEVFLDEVWVPDGRRVGAVAQGWAVAIATLMSERESVGHGQSNSAWSEVPVERLLALARHCERTADPIVRQELARAVADSLVAELTTSRFAAMTDGPPGPQMSVLKLGTSGRLERASELASTILADRLTADTGEWGMFAWTRFVLGVPGMCIGGGTDDIQRTILGERVLGLPREPIGGVKS